MACLDGACAVPRATATQRLLEGRRCWSLALLPVSHFLTRRRSLPQPCLTAKPSAWNSKVRLIMFEATRTTWRRCGVWCVSAWRRKSAYLQQIYTSVCLAAGWWRGSCTIKTLLRLGEAGLTGRPAAEQLAAAVLAGATNCTGDPVVGQQASPSAAAALMSPDRRSITSSRGADRNWNSTSDTNAGCPRCPNPNDLKSPGEFLMSVKSPKLMSVTIWLTQNSIGVWRSFQWPKVLSQGCVMSEGSDM